MEEANPGQETLMPNDKEFELDDLESFSFDDLSMDEAPPVADASSGEDPFGVWVKSAPEDVVPEPESATGLEDALPEEDFLSSEELANLDDSFDFVTVSEEPLEGETPLEDEIAFLDAPEALEAERVSTPETSASFDEVSLDDFVSFDDVPMEDVPDFTSDPLVGTEAQSTEEDLDEDFLDIDIDIEDDIGDEELEIIEGVSPRGSDALEDVDLEEVNLDSFSSEDVDLSEFGDFEEVTPVAEGPLASAEDLPEVMDIPEIAPLADDLELPDVDLGAFSSSGLEEPVQVHDDDFFEETIIDEPVTVDLEPDDHTDLDHIMALEEDLTSGIRTEAPAPEPVAPREGAEASSDLAALILSKIEQELSSIKQEISELKKEVTHLRVAPVEPTPESYLPDPVVETVPEVVPGLEAEPAETKPHGFFDEEDDETIALTGDELDNILSTAEISEGEEPGLSLDEDLLTMDQEGNLLDTYSEQEQVSEDPTPVVASEALHVTDEEFLAGTALDLNEPEPSIDEEDILGIPESIELEEGLPLGLEDDQTEDLLASAPTDLEAEEDFEVSPLPEGLMEAAPEPLEIPFDDDIGLDLDDVAPLAPVLGESVKPLHTESAFEALPDLADLPALDSDDQGWSPTVTSLEEVNEVELSLEEEPAPAFEAPVFETPVGQPPVPAAPMTTGSLTPGLKDELKAVLQYMDKLLASLPDDKIQEFAESEHFEVYKRLFEELGLIE